MRSKGAIILAVAVLAAVSADTALAQSQHPTKGLFGRKANEPAIDVHRDKLAPEELKLDCKKLSGRMQIRIMQMRSERPQDAPSSIAGALQKSTRPVYGGTTYSLDSAKQMSSDRAWLEAANKQLSAKNCRTFDLEAELKRPASDPPPSLQQKPAAAQAGAQKK